MNFKDLALILDEIEQVSSRIKITELLAILWQKLLPSEAWETANLIQGQLLPAYENLEFQMSEKTIAKTWAKIAMKQGGFGENNLVVDLFGETNEATLLEQVRKKHREQGDWGQAVQVMHQELVEKRTTRPTIATVYRQLTQIAHTTGEGCQEIKQDLLIDLYQELDPLSAKIVTRIIIGRLRLGFSLMTILDSLSWAGSGDKSESKQLEEIFQKKADIGLLAQSYLQLKNFSPEQRLSQLAKDYQIQVGVPLVPALCQRLNSSHEIIEKMEMVIAEPKYDGMRVQIHLQKDQDQVKVAAFTRSLENVSFMFPELEKLAALLPVSSIILDSEAVGLDKTTGKLLPFQETMTRRRKHDIQQKSLDLPMVFFIFDILYLDGRQLLNQPLQERKKILSQIVPESQWSQVSPFITTDEPDQLHQYHLNQLKLGLEGMVAKQIDSTYQSGRKGWNWVKIKEEEGTRGKLNDTLDLVVMGLYAGKGKRHEFGVGAFLVGLPSKNGEYLTISKIGTGLTDEQFRQLKKKAEDFKVIKKPLNYQVNKLVEPDVWLAPALVAEIAADEMTKSTIHTSGYGLRFPRLIGWRTDKSPAEATIYEELQQIKVA